MPLPKEVTFVTFDVYGTLIDWETGAYDAFSKEAEKDGYTLVEGGARPALPRDPAGDQGRVVRALRRGPAPHRRPDLAPARLAARAVALRVPPELGRPLAARSRRPTRSSTASRKKFELGLISNIDDKLLGETRRWFKTDFDLVVTAQQVRSYKPDPAHFKEAERRIGTKKGWVHVASSYYYDVEPCIKAKIPVIWVNRNKETLDASQKKPTAEVKTLLEAAKLLGAA